MGETIYANNGHRGGEMTYINMARQHGHNMEVESVNNKEIKELEQENAELKCECRRCVHTDCPCVLPDFGKTRNGICDHFKDVFDENAELKEELAGFKLKVAALEGETPWKDIKDKSEVIGKLTKAKELLKTLLLIADNKVSQMEYQLCVADTKHFLKEVE